MENLELVAEQLAVKLTELKNLEKEVEDLKNTLKSNVDSPCIIGRISIGMQSRKYPDYKKFLTDNDLTIPESYISVREIVTISLKEEKK